ncbi:hypothetical protein GCM10009566_74360 [Streptomyces murinus]
MSGTHPPREHNGVDTPTEQRTRPVAPEGADAGTGKALWDRLPAEARAGSGFHQEASAVRAR